MGDFIAVCSNLPRPSVGSRKNGRPWYLRDTHHIAQDGKTLCGRNSADWLPIPIATSEAAASPDCCGRCGTRFRTLEPKAAGHLSKEEGTAGGEDGRS